MSEVKWTGGVEHWTRKGDIKLFLWQKKAAAGVPPAGTLGGQARARCFVKDAGIKLE
jgi:hypothetical protein